MLTLLLLLSGCSVDDARQKKLDSKFFSKVEIIGSRGVGVGEFNKPRSIAVDREDNIYVVDMSGRVQKFTPDGKFVLLWQMPQTDLGKPKGMGRDKDGNIIVVEPHYQRINIFSTQGKLITQFGKHGTNAGELIMPRAVAIDSHGDFFLPEYTVVDRIQEFAATDKHFMLNIGHSGIEPGNFNRPEGVDIDSADRIYVADSCNHRIQIFSPDGKLLKTYGKAGQAPGEMSYPYDVRVDKKGFQFVCEFENSRIQIFDPNGQSVEIIGKPGYEPGEFANPYGIALDSKGNLYVADSQNHRVQKFIRRQETANGKLGKVDLISSLPLPKGEGRDMEISQRIFDSLGLIELSAPSPQPSPPMGARGKMTLFDGGASILASRAFSWAQAVHAPFSFGNSGHNEIHSREVGS